MLAQKSNAPAAARRAAEAVRGYDPDNATAAIANEQRSGGTPA
jgi:hypothetical protein